MWFTNKVEDKNDEELFLERERSARKLTHVLEDHKRALDKAQLDHDMDLRAAKSKHELDLAQRDFDLKNASDKRVMEAETRATKAENDMAILKKEVEMMQKVVDINSDIVDVKDIINKLITALPKIDLNSITVNSK